MKRFIASAILFLVPFALSAEEKELKPGTVDPATTPLEVTITGKVTKYTLDLTGTTSKDYAKSLEEASKNGRPVRPPAVDLVVKVTNTSKEKIQVWNKGDTVAMIIQLSGKGALNLKPSLATTLEFRLPEAVVLEAGKSIEFPVKVLSSGFRGNSDYSYWTDAGEYELFATFRTGVSPAPKGAEDQDGFGIVRAKSKAFPITVELKK